MYSPPKENKGKPIQLKIKIKKTRKLEMSSSSSPKTKTRKNKKTPSTLTEFKQKGISVLDALSEKELSTLVLFTNEDYYNNPSTTLLSDNEYDILKEYVQKRFPKNEAIQEIGAPVGKNKAVLPFMMPSMDKIKPDTQALAQWMSKYHGPYALSCKLDGVSGLFYAENPAQPKLYTRGDGKIGQDIHSLLKKVAFPKPTQPMVVRGEFIIPKAVFDAKYKTTFANPRNLVSGIINSKTTDEKVKDVHFVAYEVISPAIKPSEQYLFLKQAGFEVVKNQFENTLSNETLSALLTHWRGGYEYEIDGVIVANDDIYARQEGNPEHAFAFKMVLTDQLVEAKVVDVIWTASKNGYLKPRVRIEPVVIGGVTIEYATGFNGQFIESNRIGVGALVQLTRSGDVIPHILSVITPAEITKMPDVAYHWTETHVDLVLDNIGEDMTVRQKNITDFFVGLGVDGLSTGNTKRLMEAGFDSVAVIIHMNPADFAKVDGFKTKMIDKLYTGIREKVEQASLLDIAAVSNKLGRGLGKRKLQPIFETYPGILTDQSTDEEKRSALVKIAGIGKENAKSFVENIPVFLDFLKVCGLEGKLVASLPPSTTLVAPYEKIESPVMENKHILFGKHIVMTKVRDKEVLANLAKYGGILDENMSKNIFVLIVKSMHDSSSKMEYAREHGIPMMLPCEFIDKYFTGK